MRKARPTVAGACGLAVWLVNPQSPRVLLSSSNWSSWGTEVENVTESLNGLKMYELASVNIKVFQENILVTLRKDKLHAATVNKDAQINFSMHLIQTEFICSQLCDWT